VNQINFIKLKKKASRLLNAYGMFLENEPFVRLVVSGYTRSGTTFFAETLSSIIRARYIHEPLNPLAIKNKNVVFNEREAAETIRTSNIHRKEIKAIFSPEYKGCSLTNNKGSLFLYRGRIVKLVRANFYLDELARMFPDLKFAVVIRHPCACILSRIKLGWDVPDLSNCIGDVWDILNDAQRRLVGDSEKVHVRLAVTWCLDNMQLLSNKDNKLFYYLYYENIVVDAYKEFTSTLEFMGVDWRSYEGRINNELSLKGCKELVNYSEPHWKKELDEDVIDDIASVIRAFGLDYLYDIDTGYPNNVF